LGLAEDLSQDELALFKCGQDFQQVICIVAISWLNVSFLFLNIILVSNRFQDLNQLLGFGLQKLN